MVLSLASSPGISGYKAHNAGYQALGLPYTYLPRRYNGDISEALEAVRALSVIGVSLSMPYKCTCIPFLDKLSPEAEGVGAVNTVVNRAGILTGYNTDAPAAEKLIVEHLPWRDAPWLILGAGGMAHAFAYVARKLKVKAYICARDPKKAAALAGAFQLGMLPWAKDLGLKKYILCNATSVGMPSQSSVLPFTAEDAKGVFDAVSNQSGTALVKAANAVNLPCVAGDMLALEQACLQFELYTGAKAPREAMRAALYA